MDHIIEAVKAMLFGDRDEEGSVQNENSEDNVILNIWESLQPQSDEDRA